MKYQYKSEVLTNNQKWIEIEELLNNILTECGDNLEELEQFVSSLENILIKAKKMKQNQRNKIFKEF